MALTKDHYIQLKDGVFDGTTKDDLDHLFETLAADPNRDKIVLHFHGGLFNAQDAIKLAENLTQRYQSINTYHVFFIWETGVDEVIQQEGGWLGFIETQLGLVGKEEIFQQLLMRILQFAKAKVDSANAAGAHLVGETRAGASRIPTIHRGLAIPNEADVWQEMHTPKDGREPFSYVHPAFPDTMQLQDEEKQQFHDTLAQDPDPTLRNETQKIVNGYRLTKQAKGSTPQGAAAHSDIVGVGLAPALAPTAATAPTLMSPSILEQMDQQGAAHGMVGAGLDESIHAFSPALAPTPAPASPALAPEAATSGIGALPFDFIIGKAIEILSHVIDRFSQKTDHGLYPTVVEEILRALYLSNIGKNIWDHIKQEAADAFNQPDHGGSVFVQDLNAYYQNDHHPHITLVGHSAGSIYICQLLQKANQVLPPQVKFDIVFLAPACTYKLFADTLQTCKERIASIRIFAMKDQMEQADVIVPGVYTRSLLYLVSGIFEDAPDTPILGMQRFFSTEAPFNKWPEVPLIFTYLSVSQHNNVWSIIDGGDGLSTHCNKHGDFYSEEVTLTSLGYILTNGLL